MRVARHGLRLAVAWALILASCDAEGERADAGGPSAGAGGSAGAAGGAAGSGGAPAAGSGGATTDAATCSIDEPDYTRSIYRSISDAWAPLDYAGPAVVERSTPDELVFWTDDAPPLSAELQAKLTRWLGVTVTTERRCAYEADLDLHDTVFGADPPVRVQQGAVEQLTLDGRSYDVATLLLGRYWTLHVGPSAPL